MRRIVAEPLTFRHGSASSSSFLASSFLFRLTPAATAVTSTLFMSRASVKYRNLSPDDPFGEKSTWEDPSEGIYAQWKDVDQDGFVAAAASEDVRQAHFGPEWARFSTVGRMSFAKMKEEKEHRGQPQQQHQQEEEKENEKIATTRGASAMTQAERLHQRDLDARRNMLKKNYQSYEDFVEMELLGGAGSGGAGEEEEAIGAAGTMSQPEGSDYMNTTTAYTTTTSSTSSPSTKLYTEATMEETFFQQVDGIDSKDRMVLRDTGRDELADAEALSEAEPMPVPEFMRQPPSTPTQTSQTSTTTSTSTTTRTSLFAAGSTLEKNAPTQLRRRPAATTTADTTTTTASTVPEPAFVATALATLGPLHGCTAIPLTDPSTWDTETIITFLRTAERYDPATVSVREKGDGEGAAEEEEDYVMDEVMEDAFRMATVTGETLLHVVMPPRLFRVLRRWHVRRNDIVRSAWRLHQEHEGGADRSQESLAQGRKALDEVTQQVTSELIRETILLCFPYGGATHQ